MSDVQPLGAGAADEREVSDQAAIEAEQNDNYDPGFFPDDLAHVPALDAVAPGPPHAHDFAQPAQQGRPRTPSPSPLLDPAKDETFVERAVPQAVTGPAVPVGVAKPAARTPPAGMAPAKSAAPRAVNAAAAPAAAPRQPAQQPAPAKPAAKPVAETRPHGLMEVEWPAGPRGADDSGVHFVPPLGPRGGEGSAVKKAAAIGALPHSPPLP